MHRFAIVSAMFAGTALVGPPVVNAEDHNVRHERRFYDRDGRDYHSWNDHEDRAYRMYLGEQHREYLDFGRVREPQRREYFRWRHDHPDSVLRLDVR